MAIELENLPKQTNFSPLYQQIKVLILDALKTGYWKPGELIPSEVELAAKYKVSQGTVRKAVDELSNENFLVRRQGKGTYVATHREVQTQYRFLRLKSDLGITVQLQSKILLCAKQIAPLEVIAPLNLSEDSVVVHIRRLLTFNLQPIVLEDIWVPASIFGELTAELLAEWKGPMYALFESEFQVHMVRASEKIKAIKADKLANEYLDVEIGSPLLSVNRVSYTYEDHPVEVRHAIYATENHHYSSELS